MSENCCLSLKQFQASVSKWGSWSLWKQRTFRACCHLFVTGPVCWHLSGSYRSLHTRRILDDLRMATCPQARLGDKGYRITGHHPLSCSLCGGTTSFWWRHRLSSVCLGIGQGGWGFEGCRCIFQEKKNAVVPGVHSVVHKRRKCDVSFLLWCRVNYTEKNE